MKREVDIPNKCTDLYGDKSSSGIIRSTNTLCYSFLIKNHNTSMINYECYSDGAYSALRDQGGIGIVFLRNGRKVFEYSKGFKKTTNNQMEIAAVLMVLKCFKKAVNSITIYTDSMYVIGCATLGWKRKKNTLFWKAFDKEFARVSQLCPNINFKHVKGHKDDRWNNYVDKLAVNATQELL